MNRALTRVMNRTLIRVRTVAALLAIAPLLLTGATGCGELPAAARGGRAVRVVAAESFWGSIAAQLAGDRAAVQSIISNPAQDPHAYEPTAADARRLAVASLAILNGIGYDPWASHLLAADSPPQVLDVGKLLGLREGANPHRWYDPADVAAVATAITARLIHLDPAGRAYFEARRRSFEASRLGPYRAAIAAIRRRYAGVPVGASESFFALLAPALGLRLLTPTGLQTAISEGTEVSAQDTVTAQRQISDGQIAVWIYNAQNATGEVMALNALARAHRVPVVTMTESPPSPHVSFERWQLGQLRALAAALHRATGR